MTITAAPNTIYRVDGVQITLPQYLRFSPQADITVQELAQILEACSLAVTEHLVKPEFARHFKEVGE